MVTKLNLAEIAKCSSILLSLANVKMQGTIAYKICYNLQEFAPYIQEYQKYQEQVNKTIKEQGKDALNKEEVEMVLNAPIECNIIMFTMEELSNLILTPAEVRDIVPIINIT